MVIPWHQNPDRVLQRNWMQKVILLQLLMRVEVPLPHQARVASLAEAPPPPQARLAASWKDLVGRPCFPSKEGG